MPDRAAGSLRYFAWLYSPPEQRPIIAALCAIEREVQGSLDRQLDHHVAHIRLQWWKEEAERVTAGRPLHPLTRFLLESTGGRAQSIGRGLDGLVGTVTWDLASATFESRREVEAYCTRWASAMIEPLVEYALPEASGGERASQIGRSLGAALREIELLANLATEAHAGRLRLPLDEIDRAGVEATALASPPWPPALAELLRHRMAELRGSMASVLAQLRGDEQPCLRALLVWTSLAWRVSLRAGDTPSAAGAKRRTTVVAEALAEGWAAWRAARRALSGTFTLS